MSSLDHLLTFVRLAVLLTSFRLHVSGRLAGGDGLFCSHRLFGPSVVPGLAILSEPVEFPKCHSSSFFFCNQYCLPRAFCNQLLITRKKTQQKPEITWCIIKQGTQIRFPWSNFGSNIHQNYQKYCAFSLFLPAVYELLMKDAFKVCQSDKQEHLILLCTSIKTNDETSNTTINFLLCNVFHCSYTSEVLHHKKLEKYLPKP